MKRKLDMRLGINKTLCHDSAEDWARQLHELGCRCAVFPADCRADEKTIGAYLEAAEKYDLMIAEVGIWKNALSLDSKEKKKVIEYSVEQLKLADRIGARCCVNVAGAKGALWDGPYKENFSRDTWNETVAVIQEIIDRAQLVRTWFTIEPLPWMYPTGPDEYLELIDAVDRERFAVHMDLVNMINCPQRYFFHEEFTDECFDKLGGYVKSCHIKDIQLDDHFTFQLFEKACGEGYLNLEHYAERINMVDRDMPVLIEHLSTEEEYRTSLRYVRRRLENFLTV